jgi:transcriptional regulator with XRE-family HTH domain
VQTPAEFRRRLRQLVHERFGSLDRLEKETGFSKGHASQILRNPKRGRGGRGSQGPTLQTVFDFAKALGVNVREFFTNRGVEPLLHDRERWLEVDGEGAGLVREVEAGVKTKAAAPGEASDLDVLTWIARGESDRRIAERLGATLEETRQRRRPVLFRLEAERQRLRDGG